MILEDEYVFKPDTPLSDQYKQLSSLRKQGYTNVLSTYEAKKLKRMGYWVLDYDTATKEYGFDIVKEDTRKYAIEVMGANKETFTDLEEASRRLMELEDKYYEENYD